MKVYTCQLTQYHAAEIWIVKDEALIQMGRVNAICSVIELMTGLNMIKKSELERFTGSSFTPMKNAKLKFLAKY